MSNKERIERLEKAVYEISKVIHGLPWDSCIFLGCEEVIRDIEKSVQSLAKSGEELL